MTYSATAPRRFAERRLTPDIMDEPGLAPIAHQRALRAIARINAWSRTADVLWREIVAIARCRRLATVHVLDVACGNGNVVAALARRARRSSLDLRLAGCDRSDVAITCARRLATAQGVADRTDFFVADALVDDLGGPYDVAISSLFLHQLEDAAGVAMLGRLKSVSRHAIVIDDLCRSSSGYWLAKWGCRLLTGSPVVRFDGPASVESSLTPEEALSVSRRAGLSGAEVVRRFPQRYLLRWLRPIEISRERGARE